MFRDFRIAGEVRHVNHECPIVLPAVVGINLSSDMRVDPSDDIRTDPPISRFMQVYCS